MVTGGAGVVTGTGCASSEGALTPVGAEPWYSAPDAAVNDGLNVSIHEWPTELLPIVIDWFPFDGGIVRLAPPLTFPIAQTPQDDAWEVYGEGLYASVFVNAPSLTIAIDELRGDVLPFLWRQYALEDDSHLSQGARELKSDIRRRERG